MKGEMTMKERLNKLLTIKSLVTLVLTMLFGVITVLGRVTAEEFLVIFTTVIAFYFGTQAKKE